MADNKQKQNKPIGSNSNTDEPVSLGFGRHEELPGHPSVAVSLKYFTVDDALVQADTQGPVRLRPGAKVVLYGSHLSRYDHVVFIYPDSGLIRPIRPQYAKFSEDGDSVKLTVPDYGDEDERLRITFTSLKPSIPPLWIDQQFRYTTREENEEKPKANEEQQKAEAAQKEIAQREQEIKNAAAKTESGIALASEPEEPAEAQEAVPETAPVSKDDVISAADRDLERIRTSLASQGGWKLLSHAAAVGAEMALGAAASAATGAGAALDAALVPDAAKAAEHLPPRKAAVQAKETAGEEGVIKQESANTPVPKPEPEPELNEHAAESKIAKASPATDMPAPKSSPFAPGLSVDRTGGQQGAAGQQSVSQPVDASGGKNAQSAGFGVQAKPADPAAPKPEPGIQPSATPNAARPVPDIPPSQAEAAKADRAEITTQSSAAGSMPAAPKAQGGVSDISSVKATGDAGSVPASKASAGVLGMAQKKEPASEAAAPSTKQAASAMAAPAAIEQHPQYQAIKKQMVASWVAERGSESDRAGSDPELTEYKALHSTNDQGITLEQQVFLAFKQQQPREYERLAGQIYSSASQDPVVREVEISIAQKRVELELQGLSTYESQTVLRQFERQQWGGFVARFPGKAAAYAGQNAAIGEAAQRAGLWSGASHGPASKPADVSVPGKGRADLSKILKDKGAGFESRVHNIRQGGSQPVLAPGGSSPMSKASTLDTGHSRGAASDEGEDGNIGEPGIAVPGPAVLGGVAAGVGGAGQPAGLEQAGSSAPSDVGDDALERLKRNQGRADEAVLASGSLGGKLARKAAQSQAGKQALKGAGQATSKIWYYGFGSAAATFFSGLDFMLGALVMDFYWLALHRRNKELFPMKTWQKIVTVAANLIPPVLLTLLLLIIMYALCSNILTYAAVYVLLPGNACKNFDLTNAGSRMVRTYDAVIGGSSGPLSLEALRPAITAASAEVNIDPCILTTVVAKESSRNPSAIGHDHHDGRVDPFNTSNPPLYGLDWNHSHGIGLTQWTIFPPARNPWIDANTPSRRIFSLPSHPSPWYTIPELLDPNLSLKLTAKSFGNMLQSNGGNLQAAFGSYNGSGTNGSYAQSAMARYNICKNIGY